MLRSRPMRVCNPEKAANHVIDQINKGRFGDARHLAGEYLKFLTDLEAPHLLAFGAAYATSLRAGSKELRNSLWTRASTAPNYTPELFGDTLCWVSETLAKQGRTDEAESILYNNLALVSTYSKSSLTRAISTLERAPGGGHFATRLRRTLV